MGGALPGVPALVKPLSDGIFVHGCQMGPVLAQGIAFTNYDSFLSSGSVPYFLRDNIWLARAPEGHTLYIPPGMYYNILYVDKEFKKLTGKKKEADPCAFCAHAVLAWDGAAQLITDPEMQSMHMLNQQVFDAKSKLEMWNERAAWFRSQYPREVVPHDTDKKDKEKKDEEKKD